MTKKLPKGYLLPEESGLITKIIKKYVKKYEPLPEFPYILQIQTQSGCNAACAFCPNNKTKKKLTHGVMEWDLFRKIIDECVQYPVKRISPYLMNEPLLDRGINDKIKYITQVKKKSTYTKINTNASLLDEEMALKLLDSGIDRVNISFHGITKNSYEESMKGMNFKRNLRNAERFAELKEKKNLKKPRIRITMIHTSLVDGELEKIRTFWNKRGLKVNVHAFENRTNRDIQENKLNLKKWKALRNCRRLMEQAFILYNGDVVLCCVDWERSTVLGNLREQTLKEIWNNEPYMDIRKKYFRGDVSGLLCGKCMIQDEEDFVMR